jgi:hypothetical protein
LSILQQAFYDILVEKDAKASKMRVEEEVRQISWIPSRMVLADWMYLLEEAIVPLKKALIPVGHDLDGNISQRVQSHESIISLKSFMLLFIKEYDQDLSVVIACFAEKLSSI